MGSFCGRLSKSGGGWRRRVGGFEIYLQVDSTGLAGGEGYSEAEGYVQNNSQVFVLSN